MKALVRFPQQELKLSQDEKKVVEKLQAAAEIISTLYLKQKNPRYPGANFYPHDATKRELELAAQKNPAILDPYTIVERRGEKLVATPYHVKFKKEISKIASLLREAAHVSKDKNFKEYLKARAHDLLRDTYDRSNILWLKTDQSRIGFVIGPFDRYLDHHFFVKRAYMAWIGILDRETTEEVNKFKELILTSERVYLPGSRRARIALVKTRVENTLVFAGLIADFLFVGNNLPSSADIELIEKYGTLFTIFKPTHQWRFKHWVLPIFQRVFTEEDQKKFSEEELRKAFLKSSVLHEACHSLMRYKDAPERLEEYFPYIDELFTDLLGIKGCGTLILKNALAERELEAIAITTVCHSLYFYASLKVRPHLNPYATGGGLILEFLQKGGALTKKRDGFHFDSYRALMALNQLTSIVEYYIALGNRNEIKEFLKKFSMKEIFAPFDAYLKDLPTDGTSLLTKMKRSG